MVMNNQVQNGYVLLRYVGNAVERSFYGNASGKFYKAGTASPEIYVHPGDVKKFLRWQVDGKVQFVEAEQEEVEAVEASAAPVSTEFMDAFTVEEDKEFDFTSLSGIGDSTQEKLHAAGYTDLVSVVADGLEDFKTKYGDEKNAGKVYEIIQKAYDEQGA